MARFDSTAKMHVESVRNPEGVGVYCYSDKFPPLAMIGRYSASMSCGGLDTLRRNFDLARDLCSHLHGEGYGVLCEGFITEKQTGWLEELASLTIVKVLCVRSTLEECVDGVRKRRARVGEVKDPSAEYIDYQIRSCERTMRKLELGDCVVNPEWVERDALEQRLLNLFGIQ
jgi:hypothetical protein